MPGWLTSEPAYLVFGALLAGLVGLGTQWAHRHYENGARRRLLYRVLSDQLHEVALTSKPFDPKSKLMRRPIVISAARDLLQTGVLDARKDVDVIYWLVEWQAIESMFNEQVRYTSDSMVQTLVSSGHTQLLESLHNNLNYTVGQLAEYRSKLLSVMPVEYRERQSNVSDLVGPGVSDIRAANADRHSS